MPTPHCPDRRVCRVCGIERSILEFSGVSRRRPGMYRKHCKQCGNAYARSRQDKQREHKRRPRTKWLMGEYRLKEHFNMDYHDWALMYERQNRSCATCIRPLGFDKNTHVDHCHATGKVRGLLCHGCNVALGCVKDSASTLKQMVAYLEADCGLGREGT